LAKLCETYWYPIYAFLRRRGYDRDRAKDLTQELFHQMIERRSFAVADQERGRFRSFLLACLRHLLGHEYTKEQAAKRGGGYSFVPLDEVVGEDRYAAEPADNMSPETLFERRWAMTLLNQAWEALKREYVESGRAEAFEALQVCLSGSPEESSSYAEIGMRLGLNENATRQAAFRLRTRFGLLLREQIAQTVSSPAELDAELDHMRIILGG
jgi:RNA polymerase sigma-70 factor (ECF subfamily)